jgi:pyruvate/2-oxoglutarate dehydrogenase complex dihydrolipoamide acyltransferase (E2) component
MNSQSRRLSASRWAALGSLFVVVGLVGCGSKQPAATPAASPSPSAAPAPAPTAAPAPAPSGGAKLPAPTVSKNWNEFKLQAAKRMVAANPSGSYTGKPQQMLLAIPVLEIELNADGSIKNIDIMRRPSQAPETTQMAIDAVRRAGPFGDVSKLPKPWKFAEAFLFNDDKRFKPRTLDAQ